MRYRPLGRTGVLVSELSFGAMTFGAMASIAKVDEAGAARLVGIALDAGVNLFDTADAYAAGHSEELLGRALGARRRDVLVATKVGFPTGPGPNQRGLSRRHVIASAEASLRRLGSDWIDLLQIHRRDLGTPFEETAHALDDLVRRGLVRYVGLSNLPAWEAALALSVQRERGLAPFCAAQMYYSLVGRDLEHEFVPFLERAGLGLLVWSPLAAGYLTGKYTGERPGGPSDRRHGYAFPPVPEALGPRVVGRLAGLAAARGASPAQLALAWLLARPFVSSVLVGASDAGQLRENLASGALALAPGELAELDALTAPVRPYPPSYYDFFPDY
jgi:aryl-alcohol dehydrogenase-like predicted oxidoreductase